MNINSNNNNLNFTSAFRFSKLTDNQYISLHNVVSKGARQIYPSLLEKGDVAIVNHGSYDLRLQNFIQDNNLKFEYYPKIKLSDKLNENIVKSLILQNMSAKSFINNYFVLSMHILKENIAASKSVLKHVENIFKTLRLNVDNGVMNISKNGLPVIRDNSKTRTIYISPNFNSKYYVLVKPDSSNQPSSRYLLYSCGKKLIKEYETPEDIKTFNKLSCIATDKH